MMSKPERDFAKIFNTRTSNVNNLTDKGIWSIYCYFKHNDININEVTDEQLLQWIQFHKNDASKHNREDFEYLHKMSYTSYYIGYKTGKSA